MIIRLTQVETNNEIPAKIPSRERGLIQNTSLNFSIPLVW